MKTPLQELIDEMQKSPLMFASALTLIDEIGLLEKEKETMVDFAYKCRNLMAADEFAITHWYDKTFNTKEK